MDIQLPDIDGFEVSNFIRAKNKEIPILAQTAFSLSKEQVITISAGATEYLQKPVKIDDLLMVIKSYLKI
jgi:DNA-binding response OmpR family regulator